MIDPNKFHKGKYVPKNKNKYLGDISDITYRSSWEKFVMLWLDANPDVELWGSEVTQIKYICGTDNKVHTYNVDFTIKFTNGKLYLIEVKPEKQLYQPKPSKGKSKKTLLIEATAYVKNKSKWKYAKQYADDNGFIFEVWTEEKLRRIGFKL